jgi:hypothetical protein
MGVSGHDLAGQKVPDCARTHRDHADVLQREVLLRNAFVLALIVT